MYYFTRIRQGKLCFSRFALAKAHYFGLELGMTIQTTKKVSSRLQLNLIFGLFWANLISTSTTFDSIL